MNFQEAQRAAMRSRALSDLARIGLVSAGVGAGWRGLKGLLNLGERNLRPREPSLFATKTISVPARREEKKEKQANLLTDPWNWDVSTPTAHPLFMPAALATGGLGMYGGWKLTDKLLDRRRKQEIEEELENTRQEYEQALRGQSKLGEALDRLCDLSEKTAAGMSANDWSGLAQGGLLSGLGLIGLGSGMTAYGLSKKRRPSEILREAKKRRARVRMRQVPPPLYVEVEESSVPDEDEQEGSPLDKGALWRARLQQFHRSRA